MTNNLYTPLDINKLRHAKTAKPLWLIFLLILIVGISLIFSYSYLRTEFNTGSNLTDILKKDILSKDELNLKLEAELIHTEITKFFKEPTTIKSQSEVLITKDYLYADNQTMLIQFNYTHSLNLETYLDNNLYVNINEVNISQTALDKLNLTSFYNLIANDSINKNLINNWLKSSVVINAQNYNGLFKALILNSIENTKVSMLPNENSFVISLGPNELKKLSSYFDNLNLSDLDKVMIKFSLDQNKNLKQIFVSVYFKSDKDNKLILKLIFQDAKKLEKPNITNPIQLKNLLKQDMTAADNNTNTEKLPSINEINQISQLLESYFKDNARYPENLYELKLLSETENNSTAIFSNTQTNQYLLGIRSDNSVLFLSNYPDLNRKTVSNKEVFNYLNQFKLNHNDQIIYDIVKTLFN
ncbi:MAG: hypothetical protein KatS3mg091_417 [Patescibacteria group bacterium]|nr:MAG: hypothetical protein KatS3mg091_417 [Patescibacteria group bacterium]